MAKFVIRSITGTGYNLDQDLYSVTGGTDYFYESFSSTRIKEYNDASNYVLITGHDFTRDGGGTINSMQVKENGVVTGSITGLSIKIIAFKGLGNDPEGFIALLLSGNDQIYLTKHDDMFRGGKGNDRLFGEQGADRLIGGTGNDKLFGQSGADKLSGGNGDDLLRGGHGQDKMDGGAGADRYDYRAPGDGGDTVDSFGASDVFSFLGSAFKQATYHGHLHANQFISRASGNAARDGNDHFIFDRAADTLWYDADGSGAHAPVVIAHVTVNVNLGSGDILIV